jgi:hypothetical protein
VLKVRAPLHGEYPSETALGSEGGAPGSLGRRLLFVVNEAGEFVELSRVACAAKLQGYQVVFLFAPTSYYRLKAHLKSCRKNGFDAYFFADKSVRTQREKEIASKEALLQDGYLPLSLTDSASQSSSLWWARLKLWSVLVFLAFVLLINRFLTIKPSHPKGGLPKTNFLYLKSLLYAAKVYRRVKPDLVVLGQEFPGSANSWLTKVCEKDGVATMIVPFAVGTTKEMVESLHDKPEYNAQTGLFNRIAAWLFPNWVNYYRGQALLRLPGKSILMLEYLRIAPDHPWIPNQSRRIKCIAVESEEMMRHYQRMRFPAEQLRLTGAAYDDLLVRAREAAPETRNFLSQQLNISSEKKLLVCAWPTDQYGSRNIPMEFGSYKVLCEAWASSLASVLKSSDFELVICPHPVTDKNILAEVLMPRGLYRHITELDTLRVVACADLFVACVSSTIRWAIALGTPVVNYDCYEYGYTDFNTGPGVFTVTAFSEFDRQLRVLTQDSEALEVARKAQTACAPQWGFHDGHSMDRILALFEEMSASRRSGSQKVDLLANKTYSPRFDS